MTRAATPVPTGDAARVAVAFARVLRDSGLSVPIGSVLAYVDALGATGLDESGPVYWAGRTTLVRRREECEVYDRAFAAFWQQRWRPADAAAADEEHITLLTDSDEPDSGDGDTVEELDGDVVTVRFSREELLRNKDFAEYSAIELAEARRLMDGLRFAGALRQARRLSPVNHPRGRLDLRRTVRDALHTDGEAMRRRYRQTTVKPRRLVLLVDISGSMEPYARALMRFGHAAVVGRAKVEVFTFGTQLTRLTRELTTRDPDAAMRMAGHAAKDWSGGTRLGDSLRTFNDSWGQRGLSRGAVVVILSDGWDRGDPTILAEQMQRLKRVAYRVVWVNPLKASEGYAPLARGMAAALPYVDEFVEGHSLASLERLAEVVARP
jgi:uncharacterized protein with von Willebrand factor type A (vWA) domain